MCELLFVKMRYTEQILIYRTYAIFSTHPCDAHYLKLLVQYSDLRYSVAHSEHWIFDTPTTGSIYYRDCGYGVQAILTRSQDRGLRCPRSEGIWSDLLL